MWLTPIIIFFKHLHMSRVTCVVMWGSKNGHPNRHAFRRDWTTCSEVDKYWEFWLDWGALGSSLEEKRREDLSNFDDVLFYLVLIVCLRLWRSGLFNKTLSLKLGRVFLRVVIWQDLTSLKWCHISHTSIFHSLDLDLTVDSFIPKSCPQPIESLDIWYWSPLLLDHNVNPHFKVAKTPE